MKKGSRKRLPLRGPGRNYLAGSEAFGASFLAM